MANICFDKWFVTWTFDWGAFCDLLLFSSVLAGAWLLDYSAYSFAGLDTYDSDFWATTLGSSLAWGFCCSTTACCCGCSGDAPTGWRNCWFVSAIGCWSAFSFCLAFLIAWLICFCVSSSYARLFFALAWTGFGLVGIAALSAGFSIVCSLIFGIFAIIAAERLTFLMLASSSSTNLIYYWAYILTVKSKTSNDYEYFLNYIWYSPLVRFLMIYPKPSLLLKNWVSIKVIFFLPFCTLNNLTNAFW